MNSLVALMGPTAAGKTALAMAWYDRHPVSLISVDSALVYRGLDIGAGRPTQEELARAPHHLLGLREIWSPYSAADFAHDAEQQVKSAWAGARCPVLVGGTMLYFKALLEGISSLPAADDEIRQQLLEQAEEEGWSALHARLADIDPEGAARIHPNDPQRIQRALEVHALTGKSMTELQRSARPQPFPARVLKIIWAPQEREWLHTRIEARFHHMLAAGLVDEVRQLRQERRIHGNLPAMRSVGYRQVWQYLEGECTQSEMIERAIAATRQLAKRQYTWLRRQADGIWIDPAERDSQARASELVENFLERPHNEL